MTVASSSGFDWVDIALDAAGNLYVSGITGGVQRWAPGAVSGVQVLGATPGVAVLDLAVTGAGTIYLLEEVGSSPRVQRYAPGAVSGVTVAGGNGIGSSAYQFANAQGIAVDAAGNVYVSDDYNHRVQKWGPGATHGVTVAGGNGAGAASDQLSYPWAVSVDAAGNVYVADTGNDRVQRVSPGAVLEVPRISGRVRAPNGAPVPFAVVAACEVVNGLAQDCSREAWTDAYGFYSMDVTSGDWEVSASNTVDFSSQLLVTVAGSEIFDVDFTLGQSNQPNFGITGTARTSVGEAVSLASIIACQAVAGGGGRCINLVRSGAAGTFELPVEEGDWELHAYPPLSLDADPVHLGPIHVTGLDVTVVDVTFIGLYRHIVSGRVLDAAGQPTGAAGFVRACRDGEIVGDQSICRYSQLDQTGSYSFARMEDGVWTIRAEIEIPFTGGSLTISAVAVPVTVAGADQSGIDVSVSASALRTLSGTVRSAAAGTPIAGAFVSACEGGTWNCAVGSSAADGSFSLTVYDGDWSVTAEATGYFAQTGPSVSVSGGSVTGVVVTLAAPQPIPPGVVVDTASRGTATEGSPTTYWQDAITVRIPSPSGATSATATFTLPDGYSETVNLVETSPGEWTATFAAPYPHHGDGTITWNFDYPDQPDVNGSFNVYIDPSGEVRTVEGDPIVGATVTLYRADDPSGPFVAVPDGSPIMSPSNRTNPDLTDGIGHFGWDVIPGFYKVRAEKPGCTAPDWTADYVESAVLPIPPPVTDLDLRLSCPTVSAGDVSVIEGDAGSRIVKFPVTLSHPSPTAVRVDYVIEGLDATGAAVAAPGVDVIDRGGRSGRLTFAPNPRTGLTPAVKFVAVRISGDTDPEDDETFRIRFTGMSGSSGDASIGRDVGIGTIIDDDDQALNSLGVGDVQVSAFEVGKVTVQLPVALARPATETVTVKFTLVPGSADFSLRATDGGDYGGRVSGTITIRPGRTVAAVSVPIWPKYHGTPATFRVQLSEVTGSGVVLTRANGTGTIYPASG
ncbi:MAG: carboxypeptidase regulatory-like domain-containing protein [Actinomycetes bacterium]